MRPPTQQLRESIGAAYDWLLFTARFAGYRSATPARRWLVLGTAAAVASGVAVFSVVANDPGSWQVRDPRGWLPLLYVPEIALVALAFGVVWGLGAGMAASGLTVATAIADGGAPFGAAPTVNLLGLILPSMLLAAGWCYGTDTVRACPRWLVVLSVPVFPVAVVVALVWLVTSAPPFARPDGGGTAVLYPPQAMLVYQQSHGNPLSQLDRLPADPRDLAWADRVLKDGLEQRTVDPADLGSAIDTAAGHGWGLRKMTLLLHLDADTELRLNAGFAAIACGLEPDRGVTLVRAGQATKELAEHLAEILLERRRPGAGGDAPAQPVVQTFAGDE